MHSVLREKWRESLKSVLPITAIVLILCFFLVPVPSSDLIAFIFGALIGDYFGGESGAIILSFALLAAVFLSLKITTRRLQNGARIVRRVL